MDRLFMFQEGQVAPPFTRVALRSTCTDVLDQYERDLTDWLRVGFSKSGLSWEDLTVGHAILLLVFLDHFD